MTPERLLRTAIKPACAELAAAGVVDSPAAHRFMLAIAMQESGLRHRRQIGVGGVENGPAVSWYQFEKNGGCAGVLNHRVTGPIIKTVLDNYNVVADKESLWAAMQFQDIVASVAARLLIHTLPQKLPETAAQGWAQYLDGWRPGKPHPEKWTGYWLDADDIVKALA